MELEKHERAMTGKAGQTGWKTERHRHVIYVTLVVRAVVTLQGPRSSLPHDVPWSYSSRYPPSTRSVAAQSNHL